MVSDGCLTVGQEVADDIAKDVGNDEHKRRKMLFKWLDTCVNITYQILN